jgi:hypothetical protein
MSATRFLRADGSPEPGGLRQTWSAWMPARAQMQQALQAQFDAPPTDPAAWQAGLGAATWATSMRQAMGLVVVTALVAGLIPVLIQWIGALRMGTVVPLAGLAIAGATLPPEAGSLIPSPWAALLSAGQTIAGLEPALFPGWLAASLSAFGVWLNWPLRWLTVWIAYGLGVMAVAKLLGSTATLQRFYALTGYAALPFLLTGLTPIPCVGAIAGLIAWVWGLVVYVAAIRAATDLGLGRALVSAVLPAGLALLAGLLFAASIAASVVSLWL